MSRHILLIEDEQNVAAFVKKGFEEIGYGVTIAYNGATGLQLLYQKQVDAVILDLILPDATGLEICKKIRTMGYTKVPIIMLTALGTTDDIVKGLGAGSDDYLVKPFKFKELVARVEALLRRRNLAVEDHGQLLKVADLELNRDAKMVSRAGSPIKLTSTEYRLLEYLLKNKDKILSRLDILEHVWDIGFNMGTNVVDVYVNYLRNKIDKNYNPKLIQTIIGMGYMISENAYTDEDKN